MQGSTRPVGWGVIGATSQVAQKAVLPAIGASPGARLVAVASERAADGGAARFGPARAYRAYAALLDDPEVEAVYVPLPNSLHREWVERAAAAGKHVLCEKPLAPTAADAEAMGAACARAGVTLLEAYMTAFHPRARALEALVASGRLGALRFARAAFTGTLDRRDDHRWRPEMGGGALLDVGIYCIAPLLAAAGRPPARVEAAASLAKSGVDASFSGWLDWGDGFTAAIECSFDAPERQLLEIVGTEASVVVDRAYTPGPDDVAITLRHRDGRIEELGTGGADPYRAMLEHFQAIVRGAAESCRPCRTSIELLTVLERLREAAGLAPAVRDAGPRGARVLPAEARL
ncbi:MAG TPA: Gfo/Idh/MocA family oxidoreductase [Candidatus Binatia bacterium]|nr:Gfo/Idh/MocA family oxidoreductase [Candidatus Binatia bacterium]